MNEPPLNAQSPPDAEPSVQSLTPILVSHVKTATDTATTHCDVREIVRQVRTDIKLKARTDHIRTKFNEVMAATGGDRKAAKEAVKDKKLKMPAALFSGTFRERNDKAVLQHSGLLCADLDGLGAEGVAQARAKLRESLHLYADFISPSGDGLKPVFRVRADADMHLASFLAVEAHVRQLTGLPVDQKCKNVGRLCFLSYDPEVSLNEAAVELPPLVESSERTKPASAPVNDEKLVMRRKIAGELLEDTEWDSDSTGYCTCPGQDLHTSGDGSRDCKIYLDRVPTISCFHQSCLELLKDLNHDLRSRIAKAEFVLEANGELMPSEWFDEKFPRLSEQFGDAVLIGKYEDGSLYVRDVGEDFLAATLGGEGSPGTPTVFLPTEQKFYTYIPVDGIYNHQRDPALLTALSRLLLDCARQSNQFVDTGPLKFRLRSSTKLSGVLKKAQSLVAVPDDFFSTGLTEFIPCANGMLRLTDKTLLPFSPTYRRRNKLAVSFDADATCPLFLDTLMCPALDADDLDLLQRWCGLALIGENLAQRFPILTGTAGGGKGTFIRVLIGIIGQINVASLRTQLLGERFELGRFLGKTLLYGADVPEKFLNHRGASVLKSLTGGDPVALEFKRSNESPVIVCKFNAIVTCNSRLTVHLEGDTDAWRRRLAIINYDKPKPATVIADLSEQILATESSGVLNWMLDGLEKVRNDGWQLRLTPAQQKRVDDLLLESESHVIFARDALCRADGKQLTADDCYTAYIRFCIERGWITLPKNKFSNLIRDVIARMYGLSFRHDLKTGPFQEQRGWKSLEIGSVLEGDLE